MNQIFMQYFTGRFYNRIPLHYLITDKRVSFITYNQLVFNSRADYASASVSTAFGDVHTISQDRHSRK